MIIHQLHCEVERSGDATVGRTFRVACTGDLVSSTAATLRETVKPLIEGGGHILLDLSKVDYMDSMGLGTLVALKASSINAGYCTLVIEHLSEKVGELLHTTNLHELFTAH